MALKGNSRALKAKAVAYIRTSSAANVGADKDSDKRQRQAIAAFAKQAGHELVGEFNDAAVSGADHIETRPGFAAMLAYIASNGARIIIVETASRFARDLMVQEVGFAKLQALGIKLVAAVGTVRFATLFRSPRWPSAVLCCAVPLSLPVVL